MNDQAAEQVFADGTTWRGLSDDELLLYLDEGFASPEHREKAFREIARRLRARQREAGREPAAYRYRSTEIEWGNWHYISAGEATGDYSPDALRSHGYEVQFLYTEPPANREPDPNIIPSTDLIREWVEQYEHFSTEDGPNYYPDLAAFIHDQIARRATAIQFNAHPAEPPADTEEGDDE